MINARFQDDFAYGACYGIHLPNLFIFSLFNLPVPGQSAVNHSTPLLSVMIVVAVTLMFLATRRTSANSRLKLTVTAKSLRHSKAQRRFAFAQRPLPLHRAVLFRRASQV